MPERARILAALLAGLLFGCPRKAPTPAPSPQPAFASAESIRIRRGNHVVDVRCALECGNAQIELSRLQRDCVHDPQSTVHLVTERASLIAVGCCTEASSVLIEACGAEGGLGACIGNWTSQCERGGVVEHIGER